MELQQVCASGLRYTGPSVTVLGKGNGLTIDDPVRGRSSCRAG